MSIDYTHFYLLNMTTTERLPDYTEYEYDVVRVHSERPNTKVWHWSNVPEEHLYEAGYIHNFNKERLERLKNRKASKDGINRIDDYGFDFLAMENQHDGSAVFCGGQAKYYQSNVSANDIGTFLIKQQRLYKKNHKSVGYLYTLSGLTEKLQEDCNDPDFIIRHVLHRWTASTTSASTKITKSKKKTDNVILEKIVGAVKAVKALTIKECDLPLRDYQQELIDDMTSLKNMVALRIPCGMGKTLIAGYRLRQLKPDLIIAMAPLRVSVSNLQERLGCFLPDYSVLLVDSDTGGETDADLVREFLSGDGPKIIYTTFISAENVIATLLEELDDAFLLADEIHNAVGNEELCEFVNMFSSGLLMSATIPEEIIDVIDIDETLSISFADGIELGYIVDYTLWLPHLVSDLLGKTQVDVEIPTELAELDGDMCAKAMYLATGMIMTGSRRCIVYLTSMEDCDAFLEVIAAVFREYHGLEFWGSKIDSSISSSLRKARLLEFQSGSDAVYRVLASVRILDEAVDVPRCDSVFITSIGEKSSDIRMMQRVMRSGRLDPMNKNKRNNIFLWCHGWEQCLGSLELLREADPKFHKKVRIGSSNYDKQGEKRMVELLVAEAVDFQRWAELKCLTLMEKHILMIEEIRVFYEKYGIEPKLTGKKENEGIISRWMGSRRYNKKKGRLPYELENKIVESLPWFKWDVLYEGNIQIINELKTFYNTYSEQPKSRGHRDNKNENKIARWMNTKRMDKKNGTINIELEKIINKELPWFKWNPITDITKKYILELIAFYDKYKEEPSVNGVRDNGNEANLYQWISTKRTRKNKGKLTDDDINEIIVNLPWFNWNPVLEQHLRKIDEIIIFYTKYKTEPKSKRKKDDETQLAVWIGNRRKDKINNKLCPIVEKNINERLSWFRWDPYWENHTKIILELQEFYTKYGEAPRNKGLRENEGLLYSWISSRRLNRTKDTIEEKLIEKIEKDLPWFSWNPLDEKYKEALNNLSKFYDKYKEEPKSKGKREDKLEHKLASWLISKRSDRKSGKLSQEIIKDIENIFPNFKWTPKEEERDNTIQQLKSFYSRYNEEPKINGKRDDNEHYLASWMGQKRNLIKKDTINTSIHELIKENLPWFSLNPILDTHNKSISQLNDFYKKYKEPPKIKGLRENEHILASWMSTRRRDKKKDKLDADLEKNINITCPWLELN